VDLNVEEESDLLEDEVDVFVAAGFPVREAVANWRAEHLELTPVTFWAFEAIDAYSSLELGPSKWILTRFDRERAYKGGYVQAMKLPHGMSGGALFRLRAPRDQIPSLARVSLAGILVEYRTAPAKCMVSARLEAVRSVAEQLINGVLDT
jgi:hypothetical protein